MLRKAIDNNLYTCGVFLDFSKAFDTVSHKIWSGKIGRLWNKGDTFEKVSKLPFG